MTKVEAVPSRIIGEMVMSVVQKIHQPIYDGGSQSIGQVIDDHLLSAAKEGTLVRSIEFQIEEGDWFDFADKLRKGNDGF